MAQPPFDPYAQETKRNSLAIGIGIGVLATLILVGAGYFALGLGGKKISPVTQLTAKTQPVLPASGTREPALPIAKPENIKMPDDIYAWLEHLRRTEEKRKAMSADQIGELTVLATQMKTAGVEDAMRSLFTTEESPIEVPEQSKSEKVGRSAAEKRQQWKELNDFFLSVPPPSECTPIQASYTQTLGETGAMIVEILDALELAQESPEKAISALTKMQGTSGGRIDEFAKQTDSQVGDICSKYQTPRWFSITPDVGGGILSGLSGF
jgi:hypothetical protein